MSPTLFSPSQTVFACYDKACAPPPAGKGGSLPRSGSGSSSVSPAISLTKDSARTLYEGFEHDGVTAEVRKITHPTEKAQVTIAIDLKRDGKVVGTFQYSFFNNGKDIVWGFASIDPDLRGRGLMKEFLKYSIEKYREMGVRSISLEALSESTGDPTEDMTGSAVWGKLGFDFDGYEQESLAESMENFSSETGHKWPRGLVARVRSGKGSIKEVMAADPGNFLDGSVVRVTWDAFLNLNDVNLTASVDVSLSELANAVERYLRPRKGERRSASFAVFACLSKACAPPPVGTGGSLGGPSGGRRSSGTKGRAITQDELRGVAKVAKGKPRGSEVFDEVMDDVRSSTTRDRPDMDVAGKVLANSRVMEHLLKDKGFVKWASDKGFSVEDAAVQVKMMIDNWARNAFDPNSAFSMAYHRAAAAVHGTRAAWSDAEKNANPVIKQYLEELYAENGPLLEALVRAEYAATQAWFKERGITSVIVHRGMALANVPAPGETVQAQMFPLSSWSVSQKEAQYFARSALYSSSGADKGSVVLSTEVPVELVQSIPATGRGCLMEFEMVLIGEPLEVLVSESGGSKP